MKEISLYDYLKPIKNRRRIIFVICGISVITTLIVSLLLPKTYLATATIFPLSELPRIFKNLNIQSSALPVPTSNINIFLAILKSKTIKNDLVEKFNLQELYRCKTKESAIKRLEGNTKIKISPERVILVSVIDTSPQRAADMANFYIENLNRLNRKINISTASQVRRFIEKRLTETKETLKETEKRLEEYQVKEKVIGKERETAKTAGELQGRLIAARIQLESLKKYTTIQNPEVVKLQNKVSEMEKSLIKLPPLETRLARLIREVKIQETLYSLLSSEYEQAKIEEARDTPIAQVLDRATPPRTKYKPRIKLNVALSGLISLFFAILLVFFLNYLEKARQE